jgi:hypothetical protein
MFCRLNHSDGLSAADTIAENAQRPQGINTPRGKSREHCRAQSESRYALRLDRYGSQTRFYLSRQHACPIRSMMMQGRLWTCSGSVFPDIEASALMCCIASLLEYFPIAFSYWIIRLKNFNAPIMTFRLFTSFVLPRCYAPGIIRPARCSAPIVTPWCPLGYLGYLFLKLGSHY